MVPALYTKESGSGGLGHSLVACLVNSDIVINIYKVFQKEPLKATGRRKTKDNGTLSQLSLN